MNGAILCPFNGFTSDWMLLDGVTRAQVDRAVAERD
ncbi:hypothetical protein LEAN103870_07180 [Legionella anisa]